MYMCISITNFLCSHSTTKKTRTKYTQKQEQAWIKIILSLDTVESKFCTFFSNYNTIFIPLCVMIFIAIALWLNIIIVMILCHIEPRLLLGVYWPLIFFCCFSVFHFIFFIAFDVLYKPFFLGLYFSLVCVSIKLKRMFCAFTHLPKQSNNNNKNSKYST